MDALGYAVLYLHGAAIELECTAPLFVSQLLNVLADEIGDFGISACKLPVGDLYHWRLYGIDEDLGTAWRLIVQRFWQGGWEPLGDPSTSPLDSERALCFRFKGDEPDQELALEGLHAASSLRHP